MVEKKDLFVGIRNSNELRRNILEASKSAISCMKIHQKITHLHTNKIKLKKRLKDDIIELKILLLKLDKIMPKSFGDVVIDDVTPKKIIEKPIDLDKKEIDVLHKQLKAIEERLSQLDD